MYFNFYILLVDKFGLFNSLSNLQKYRNFGWREIVCHFFIPS